MKYLSLILMLTLVSCVFSSKKEETQPIERLSSNSFLDSINGDKLFVKISYVGPQDLPPTNEIYISNRVLDWKKELDYKVEQAYDTVWVTRVVVPDIFFDDLIGVIYELYDRPNRIELSSIVEKNRIPYGFNVNVVSQDGEVFTDYVLMKENCEFYFTRLVEVVRVDCSRCQLLI